MIPVNSIMRHPGPFVDGLKNLAQDTLQPWSNSKIVEIGCYMGESTLIFLNSGLTDKIICVDPYSDSLAKAELDHPELGWTMSSVREEFIKRVLLNFPQVELLQTTSVRAARALSDEKFDLVYIDGNHSYESVKEDIAAWLPLVKSGGWIAGHDYNSIEFPGCVRAVDEAFGKPHKIYQDNSWAVHL